MYLPIKQTQSLSSSKQTPWIKCSQTETKIRSNGEAINDKMQEMEKMDVKKKQDKINSQPALKNPQEHHTKIYSQSRTDNIVPWCKSAGARWEEMVSSNSYD